MTYESGGARTPNRVLVVLVVLTIAVVAVWALAGGLERIPVVDTDRVVVTE